MSESQEEDSKVTPVKKSIASRLAEARIDLPDNVREKIREMASSLGKSEAEVYQEIITKGLASTSEDVAYLLARKKVIDSLTPSEQILVLKNVEAYMKEVQRIFGTWKETPTPTITQPTTTVQPTVSQPAGSQPTSPVVEGRPFLIPADQVDKAIQEILKAGGLPNVSIPQPTGQTQGTPLSQGSIITLALAKYAIDKLGTTAVTALVNNPEIQKSIAGLLNNPKLQEWLSGFLGDLGKLSGEEKPSP